MSAQSGCDVLLAVVEGRLLPLGTPRPSEGGASAGCEPCGGYCFCRLRYALAARPPLSRATLTARISEVRGVRALRMSGKYFITSSLTRASEGNDS